MKHTPHHNPLRRILPALFLPAGLLCSGTARAATETWDGGHGSANAWFANLNWADDTAPLDFDDLVFTGTARLNHNSWADIAGGDNDFDINSITFDNAAGAFVINNGGGPPGSVIKMHGDITNDSTNLQTMNFNFQLNADVTANAASGDITIGGVISEDGSARSLIKSGSSTLSLTGANTYTGTTDINVGKLQLGDGGTTGSLSTSSAIDIASGAAFIVNRTDTVTQGTDFSSAAITGAGTIAHHGTGTLILDRANSLGTGTTHIGDLAGSDSATRVLEIRDNSSLGSGQITFYKGGTLDLGADALTVSNFIFNGNYSSGTKTIKLDSDGAGHTGTIAGNMIIQNGNAGSFQMEVGAADTLTMSGTIGNYSAGGAGITKTGDGTLILSGTNTYKGATTVSAGVLKLSGGSAIDDIRNVVVNAGGTLDLNGSSETINRLTGSGTIDNTAGAGSLIVGHNNASFTFDGTLTDSIGTLQLKKTGDGTLTLTEANTHAGGTNIAGSDSLTNIVNVQHNDALGTGAFWFESGGVLELGVGGLTISNAINMPNWSGGTRTMKLDLAGAQTGELSGNMWHQNTTFGTIEFNVGADDNLTYSGNIQAGSSSGAGIKKVGDGTLTLSGANTYKGKTGVYGGTLSLASGYTHTQSGSYEIKDGGTLKIADGVNISTHAMTIGVNGVISPGNSPGTAITGAQTWNDGGSYLWEINNSNGTKGVDEGWDWLDITGTLDLTNLTAGGFTIDITSLTTANDPGLAAGFDYSGLAYGDPFGTTFIIASADTIDGFDASLFTLDDSAFVNGKLDWSIIESGTDLVLTAVFVPEPSSTALLGLGLGSLLLRRRRS